MSRPARLEAAVTLPGLPDAVPRRRFSRFEKWLGRRIFSATRFGWVGGFIDSDRQVLVAAPHTSNWDAVVGLAAIAQLEIRLTVYGKNSLFFPPLGWFLRRYGAIPVDRSRPGGVVERAEERFADGRPFLLGMTPEGTRARVDEWKTGFHRIAVSANVPMGIVAIDWAKREIGVVGTLEASGDLQADLAAIGALLDGVQGRNPDDATLPQLDGNFLQ